MLRKNFILLFFEVLFLQCLWSEIKPITYYQMVSDEGDTSILCTLPPIIVYGKYNKNSRAYKKYTRMVYSVRKVYFLALLARYHLQRVDSVVQKIPSKAKQKAYIKEQERILVERYSKEIRKLYRYEGVILIKLVDREIGRTSYELVKEMRGGFRAFWWQQVARMFGQNLKLHYDPDGEDQQIERIIQKIESGEIEPLPPYK